MLQRSESLLGNDIFTIALFQGKKNGTFLEIGAAHPRANSNTYMLEKHFEWSGIAIDIEDRHVMPNRWHQFYADTRSESWPASAESFNFLDQFIQYELKNTHGYAEHVLQWILPWNEARPRTRFINTDAETIDYSTLDRYYDFLQIDIDSIDPSLDVLDKVMNSQRFGVIFFEHDISNANEDRRYLRQKSRQILFENGYELLVNDVTIPRERSIDNPFYLHHLEDWYVDPSLFDEKILTPYRWIDHDNTVSKFPENILFNQ